MHYMIGCELRRFSQHVSIMTRIISRGIKFDQDSGGLTSTLNASILREELCEGVDLSKEKLERTPERINLHETLDGYIDAISAMHFVNLELTEDTFANLIELLDGFAQSACQNLNLSSAEGYALEVNSEDRRNSAGQLTFEIRDYREINYFRNARQQRTELLLKYQV
ncbi:MAG: hypothetical protein LAT53_07225 [Idiomarina sp.]|nr:hypothetical protein [Idiomarina sp.]